MIVTTTSGTQLPTLASQGTFRPGATIGPSGTYADGGIPAITLGGVDITSQLQGGSLGANITLRDTTIPTFQGELDEFSQSLASRFSGQGLALFTDPPATYRLAAGCRCNPAMSGSHRRSRSIQPSVANPSQVRDGTQNIAGSATGASAFTTNPAGGPAGFTA